MEGTLSEAVSVCGQRVMEDTIPDGLPSWSCIQKNAFWISVRKFLVPSSLGGRGRMDTCICMVESLCYALERISTLSIGYTPIQNKVLKNKFQEMKISCSPQNGYPPPLAHGKWHLWSVSFDSCQKRPLLNEDRGAPLHFLQKQEENRLGRAVGSNEGRAE